MPTFQARNIPLMIAATIGGNDLDRMAELWSELVGAETAAKQDTFEFLTHPPDRRIMAGGCARIRKETSST